MTGTMHLTMVLLLIVAGCKPNAEAEGSGREPKVANGSPASRAASAPDVAHPADSGASEPAPPRLSQQDLVNLVLDEEITRRTPEEAAARFARAGQLERMSVVPDRLQLGTKNDSYALRIAYVEDASWVFQAAFVELYSQDTTSVESVYNFADALIKAKLGKAKSVDKGGSGLPRKTYRIGKKLLAFISERSSQGRPVVFVEVSVPEEGGE